MQAIAGAKNIATLDAIVRLNDLRSVLRQRLSHSAREAGVAPQTTDVERVADDRLQAAALGQGREPGGVDIRRGADVHTYRRQHPDRVAGGVGSLRVDGGAGQGGAGAPAAVVDQRRTEAERAELDSIRVVEVVSSRKELS